MTIAPLPVTAFTLTCAVGCGVGAMVAALREMRGSLRRCDLPDIDLDTPVGRVEGMEAAPLVGPLSDYDCHNNRLANLALAQDGFDRRVAVGVWGYADRSLPSRRHARRVQRCSRLHSGTSLQGFATRRSSVVWIPCVQRP